MASSAGVSLRVNHERDSASPRLTALREKGPTAEQDPGGAGGETESRVCEGHGHIGRGSRGAIANEDVDEAAQVGREKEDAHEHEVGGVELDRDVVAEVEGNDVAQDSERNERAEGGGTAEEKQEQRSERKKRH